MESRQVKGPSVDVRVDVVVAGSTEQEGFTHLIVSARSFPALASLVYHSLGGCTILHCIAEGLHLLVESLCIFSHAGISGVDRVVHVRTQHLLQIPFFLSKRLNVFGFIATARIKTENGCTSCCKQHSIHENLFHCCVI